MKQALFRRLFGKSAFQPLSVTTVLVLGSDQKLWLEQAPFGNLPPTRQQIDGNVAAFDAVDENNVYVLGTNGNLWLEFGPFGTVPPMRQPVDFSVADFDPIDANTIYVLGKDGNLWLEHGPFNSVPPTREQVDGNIAAFDAIDANTIYVLGKDGNLWLEHGPFNSVPPTREQVDGNVAAFDAIDANHIYVLGSNGALWLEQGPFGTVPPGRQQVDGNVAAFSQLGANAIYVLGSDRKLWLENGPFNSVPPPRQQVDGNVVAFDPVDGENLYVLGSDGKLWLEVGPFGTVPPGRTLVDALELTNPCVSCGQLGFTAIPGTSGINADIATTGLPSLLVVCSGPFSISGFSWPATPVGGQRQTVINASMFTMTILNQDTSSTLGNRISTPTGKPVTLAPSPSGAENAVSFEYDATNGDWVLVEQLDRATPEDGLFYVSTGPKKADSNDGLSHGTAQQTIAHALSTLGTNPGIIQLLGGSFNAPSGGLTLVARQGLIGLGAMASQVLGSESGATGDAVVTLSGSRSSIENMWVRVSLKSSGGVGVRVTCTGSNENSRLTNIFCENQTESAIAFGIGDNTSLDVAEVVMIGCDSVGNSAVGSIHMQVGDGGTGNVLDITNIGGNSQSNNHGVVMAGGALVSRGLNFQSSGTADIFLHQPGVGNMSFDGGRSENAVRFLVSSSFAVTYATVKVANYTVVGLQNTDGQGVQIGWPATFDNVAIFGAKAPQYFFLRGGGFDNDNPAILTAQSCVSDHPFPFQTSWSRPGKIIRSSGTRFAGDAQFQLWSRNTTSDTWVRRMNVTSTAPFTINPFFYDAIDINLPGSNTGVVVSTPVIIPGAVGQTVTICFQQNGVGGSAFTWPVLCAWSGGTVPANCTAPRNRQSCTFRYNGRYWEQIGPVTNVLPPAVAATRITDNFGKQVPADNPFWLNQPDTAPLPTPTTPRWEHVPGGGSLGIKLVGGVNTCGTPCLGYIGDNETDDGIGLFRPGAAAVIETGMATQTTGISATFTWQINEGIICHYRDDQNFFVFAVGATEIFARGWSHGQPSELPNFPHGLTMKAGSRHTLLVKCTGTSFSVSLDGAAPHLYAPLSAADQSNLLDFTKHGILSSHLSATFTNFTVS